MSNFYSKFRNSLNETRKKIEKNRINMGENDILAEKTLFAFLNEWLKDLLKIDEENILIDKLKENETLTKEKLQLLLKDGLKEYLKLDKEILKQKGLAKLDYEKTNKLLNDKNFMDFTHELIDNKLSKLKKFANELKEQGKSEEEIKEILKNKNLSIKTEDIQELNSKDDNLTKQNNEKINDKKHVANQAKRTGILKKIGL